MAEMSAFEAVLTIVDLASKPIEAITAKVDSLGDAARRTEAGLNFSANLRNAGMLRDEAAMLGGVGAKAGEMGGELDKGGESMARLGEASGALGGMLVDFLPMFAGFAAIGSGAGMMELVRTTAEMSENLEVLSAKIGAPTAQIQKWDYIAKMSGVSADSMNAGLEKLNKNLGAAGAGKDKNLVSLLDHLKISLKDSNGHVRDATDLMPQLAAALYGTEDATQRAYMASLLFNKAGQDMLPVLDQAPAKIEEMGKSFDKYAYTFKPGDKENLKQFSDSWKNLEASTQGMKDALGANLAPLMTPVVQGIADWTAKNKDWIAHDIAHDIENLALTLKEQSGEISTYFGRIAATFSEQSSEIYTTWEKIAGFINPGTPDNATTNPGYAGNHPIVPKHANELMLPGDARTGMYGDHPLENGPGWGQEITPLITFSPEPKPVVPKHSNEIMLPGDARAGITFDAPASSGLMVPNKNPPRSPVIDLNADMRGGRYVRGSSHADDDDFIEHRGNWPGLTGSSSTAGSVDVSINFQNAPAGMVANAKATGAVNMPKLNVGRSRLSSD